MSEVSLNRSEIPDNPSTYEADLLIPKLVKDSAALAILEKRLVALPTHHRLVLGDGRDLSKIESSTVHLVLMSPPYWTLKEYPKVDGQLGRIIDYEAFLKELDKILVRNPSRILGNRSLSRFFFGSSCTPRPSELQFAILRRPLSLIA